MKASPKKLFAHIFRHCFRSALLPILTIEILLLAICFLVNSYNNHHLPDEQQNPQKKPVWTGVCLDPAGNGWMLSCVAPVYQGAKLEGVVGLDVTVENVVKNTLALDLPWGASAFLVDDSGMILMMSEKVETLFSLKELKQHVYNEACKREQLKPENYNMFKHHDARLVGEFKRVFNSQAVIINLVKNALEAIGVGRTDGKINVTLSRVEGKTFLGVKDNGGGITRENTHKIMNSGFNTKNGGHGLGLHSFAVFLTANKGKIPINSAGINQGAQVLVEVGDV